LSIYTGSEFPKTVLEFLSPPCVNFSVSQYYNYAKIYSHSEFCPGTKFKYPTGTRAKHYDWGNRYR
jgi:hypothetical protein